MLYGKFLTVAALLGGLLAIANPAHAGISEFPPVTVNLAAGTATFSIDFPQVPEFYAVDRSGRLADSFQIQISADPNGNPVVNPTTVIRGDEIRFATALRIRNGSPPSTDPQSGGYGSIRGTVPFTLNGTDLTFTTPLSLIGAPNGNFSYYAFTTQGGFTAAQVEARSVPLPSALAAVMMMLGIGIVFVMGRSMGGSRGVR
jgi:hypothetical protein